MAVADSFKERVADKQVGMLYLLGTNVTKPQDQWMGCTSIHACSCHASAGCCNIGAAIKLHLAA